MTQDKDEVARCQLCGEPMPEGEQMFNYHGHSGPCPKHTAKPTPNGEQPTWMDDNILICGKHSVTFTKRENECFVCSNRVPASAPKLSALAWLDVHLDEFVPAHIRKMRVHGESITITGAARLLDAYAAYREGRKQ